MGTVANATREHLITTAKEAKVDGPQGSYAVNLALNKALASIDAAGDSYRTVDPATLTSTYSTFNSEIEAAINTFNSDVVLSRALQGGGVSITEPISAFETRLMSATPDPIIQGKVIEKGREKRAALHVDDFLKGPQDLNTFTSVLLQGSVADQALIDQIHVKTQEAIKQKVDRYRADLASGLINVTQLRADINAQTNPALKSALEAFWNEDETRVKNAKADAEKAKYQPEATAFRNTINNSANRVSNAEGRIDITKLSDQIKNSPGFSTLPLVVQNVIKNMTNVKKEEHLINEEIGKSKIEEAEIKQKIAEIDVRNANIKLVLKKLSWIAGGVAAGAVIGGVGTAFGAPLLASLLPAGSLASFLTNPAVLAVGGGLTVFGGGLGGLKFGENINKSILEARAAVLAANNKSSEQKKVVAEAKKALTKGDISALKAFSTIAGTMTSITNHTDSEKTIKAFLEEVGVSQLETLAALA